MPGSEKGKSCSLQGRCKEVQVRVQGKGTNIAEENATEEGKRAEEKVRIDEQ